MMLKGRMKEALAVLNVLLGFIRLQSFLSFVFIATDGLVYKKVTQMAVMYIAS